MADLRKQFHEIMCELAEKDKDVILITGDLGYSFNEGYQRSFPNQFLNVGCMEQTMMGIAAGMALLGKKPYVYSGSIFLTSRAHEQIRDDIAYNQMNVKICGTGASGFLGFTHNWQGTENENDLLKNMPINCRFPEDKEELKQAMLLGGATFIRI